MTRQGEVGLGVCFSLSSCFVCLVTKDGVVAIIFSSPDFPFKEIFLKQCYFTSTYLYIFILMLMLQLTILFFSFKFTLLPRQLLREK